LAALPGGDPQGRLLLDNGVLRLGLNASAERDRSQSACPYREITSVGSLPYRARAKGS